jgi:hypothetical protein
VALQARNILTTTGDEPPGWLPVRDLEEVSANELLDTVRTVGEEQYLNTQALQTPDAVARVLERYDEAAEAALRGVTAKDLAATLAEVPTESA